MFIVYGNVSSCIGVVLLLKLDCQSGPIDNQVSCGCGGTCNMHRLLEPETKNTIVDVGDVFVCCDFVLPRGGHNDDTLTG